MPHNSLSLRRIPAGDLSSNPAQSNLPIETEALPLQYITHLKPSAGFVDLIMSTNSPFPVAGEDYNAQQQSTGRHGIVIPSNLNPTISGSGLQARSALDATQLRDTACPKASLEMAPESSCDRYPSMHGNVQHQPGWDFGPRPDTSISSSRPFTSQPHSNNVDSVSGEQTSTSQPRSVKHLTCWYWAMKNCRLPEDQCLYSHSDTGKLAGPPIQKEPGRESSFYNASIHRGSFSNPHFVKPRVITTLTPN